MTLPRALLRNLRQSCGRVHNLGEGQTRDRHLEKVNAAVSEDWLPCDWETDRLLEPEFEQRLRWNGKLLAPPGGRNSGPSPSSSQRADSRGPSTAGDPTNERTEPRTAKDIPRRVRALTAPSYREVAREKRNDVPLITMSVSSKVSCELPDIRPAEDADINWPNTVDPRGATTLLSTWRLVSRLAVNRNPALCLFVSIESTVRTRTRVPAGTVTLFCGAGEAAANPRITVVAKRIAFVILFSLSRELGTPSDERQGGVNLKINDQEQLVFHLKKPGGSDATQRLFDAVVILCEQLGAHFPMLHCVLCQFMGLLIRQLTIVAREFLDVGN